MCTVNTEPTTSKGIRLPDSLWAAIERAARDMEMSSPEWIRRRLASGVRVVDDVQTSPGGVPISLGDTEMEALPA